MKTRSLMGALACVLASTDVDRHAPPPIGHSPGRSMHSDRTHGAIRQRFDDGTLARGSGSIASHQHRATHGGHQAAPTSGIAKHTAETGHDLIDASHRPLIT